MFPNPIHLEFGDAGFVNAAKMIVPQRHMSKKNLDLLESTFMIAIQACTYLADQQFGL